ncbi:Protein-tyrosine phosphatase [Tolypocladium paradoxum]|uniref:Protein-tyrosine phosphatase n=1 Tax=Tolypocladium paradoxum TaxID=94208 RepID=A0A2S4KU30_9HYPO|nr:Protein-tyrosine phosphatase [Tolypocladium paradoxum]
MFLKTFTAVLAAAAAVQAIPAVGKADKEDLAHRSVCLPVKLAQRGNEVGLRRFEWVTNHFQHGNMVARSSAPHYVAHDSDHMVTPETIKFLNNEGITHVISLNHEAHAHHIKTALANGGIAYTPLPVPDFGPPTLQDFKKGWEAFVKHRSGTLVWCGYGHGRTGTMISALQTYAEKEKLSPQALTREDYDNNHVEREAQKQVLEELQRSLNKRPAPAVDAEAGPSTKKPKVAASGAFRSWETLKTLLEIEGQLPEDLISHEGTRDAVGELLAEYNPSPPPLAVAADEMSLTFAADETALWTWVRGYIAASPAAEDSAELLSPEVVGQWLDEFLVEYPPLEAGPSGASAIGDADIVAFLDGLPAVTEGDLLALNLQYAEEAVAVGDADVAALVDSLPVEGGALEGGVAIEAAGGASILEGLIEVALEITV